MSYAEHRLEKFTNPVSALADRPQLSPAKLKAAFDACPNELREKHNSLCDALGEDKAAQAQANEAFTARLDGYRAETFPGEILRTMLEKPLQDEISAKVEQADYAQTAEAVAQHTAQLAHKCNMAFGTFSCKWSNGSSLDATVSLGFQPQLVLVLPNTSTASSASSIMLAWQGNPHNQLTLTEDGFFFKAFSDSYNGNNSPFRYVAFYYA